MALSYASFYGLARVNGSGPEVKNWAVTDSNWQTTALLLKAQEMHVHNGATPMRYPGFIAATPSTPIRPNVTQVTTGGSLSNGLTVGVRLSWINSLGLETEASPEVSIQTPVVVTRPSPLTTTGAISTPVPGAVQGGTWLYTLTKRLGTGESETADVLTVAVPYTTGQTSFAVPLNFAPISSYTDGTDSLCLYRSTGFDSSFVLLSTITATPGLQNNLSSYTDGGSIQNSTQQPPASSQFAKQNSVTIDWTSVMALVPSTAAYMNVYITQQAGVYGVNSLLQSYNLLNPATPTPNNYTYQGVETLAPGYPQEFSQIPFGAAPVNLSTQAIGAPVYTTVANAQGYQVLNFVFPVGSSNATPVFGAAYVDPNVGQLKVALSTPAGAANPAIFTTLAGVGSGYAHPLTESGGHIASHIYAAPTGLGGPTQDQLNNVFSTPVDSVPGNWRIQVQNIFKPTATPSDLFTGQTGVWTTMPDMDTISQWPTGISPDFTGQWFTVNFQSAVLVPAGGALPQIVSAQLLVNGNAIPGSIVSQTLPLFSNVVNTWSKLSFEYTTPLTRSNNRFQVQWMASVAGTVTSYGGNVVGQEPRRALVIREVF